MQIRGYIFIVLILSLPIQAQEFSFSGDKTDSINDLKLVTGSELQRPKSFDNEGYESIDLTKFSYEIKPDLKIIWFEIEMVQTPDISNSYISFGARSFKEAKFHTENTTSIEFFVTFVDNVASVHGGWFIQSFNEARDMDDIYLGETIEPLSGINYTITLNKLVFEYELPSHMPLHFYGLEGSEYYLTASTSKDHEDGSIVDEVVITNVVTTDNGIFDRLTTNSFTQLFFTMVFSVILLRKRPTLKNKNKLG